MRPPPDTNAVMEAYGWRTARTLDPVRAAALHEAIQCWPDVSMSTVTDETKGDLVAEVLQLAERFERWLAGTDEAAT